MDVNEAPMTEGVLNITSPCDSGNFEVTAARVNNPTRYFYTGADPSLDLIFNYSVVPDFCEVSFACRWQRGKVEGLCHDFGMERKKNP